MSSVARILTILTLLVVGLLAGVGLIWYLAYGVTRKPPARATVTALTAPAEIRWGPQGDVSIHAQTERDALTALGYVHGRRRAWSVVLWRQAASGRLGEWFGDPVLPLDRLARQLGLATTARAAFERLRAEEQGLLTAYTAGLNAALYAPEVRLRQEFVLLDLQPDPWLPWHTLALERLFAWLSASPPPAAVVSAAGPAAAAFFDADRTLRRWLHLHGFENSIAWAAQDTVGTHLFQRHVFGDNALPFYQEATLTIGEGPPLQVASLPGTPFFPAGRGERHAWALLLTSTADLQQVPWDSAGVVRRYERITSADATEHLSAFLYLPGRLVLADEDAAGTLDTVWTLRWPGLDPASDMTAWRALLTDEAQPFLLMRGDGLRLAHEGTWQVLGTPAVVETLPSGVFVGLNDWSRYAAELLRTQETDHVDLHAWISDAYSTWAARSAPPLIAALDPAAEAPPLLREALTYLHNWDFAYDRASIAASIFDTWMTFYQEARGGLSPRVAPDSLLSFALSRTLAQAVDTLALRFGGDLSQWRWEHVQPDRRFFPIWSVEALRGRVPGDLTNARFAPLDLPGSGHPSTLAWGPSPVQRTMPAPAAWEAWVRTDTWDAFTARRRYLNADAAFGRYLLGDRPPDALPLAGMPAAATTTLSPSSP